jgi:hypothetical protein
VALRGGRRARYPAHFFPFQFLADYFIANIAYIRQLINVQYTDGIRAVARNFFNYFERG